MSESRFPRIDPPITARGNLHTNDGLAIDPQSTEVAISISSDGNTLTITDTEGDQVRVLNDGSIGSHLGVFLDPAAGSALAKGLASLPVSERTLLAQVGVSLRGAPGSHRYGYRFPKAAEFKPGAKRQAELYAALDALGNAMANRSIDDPQGTMPQLFTYFGQFIDHDITSGTDSDQLEVVVAEERPPMDRGTIGGAVNKRTAWLDLDSLYGDGPSFGGVPTASGALYNDREPGKFNLDLVSGEMPVDSQDRARGLPRIEGTGEALIGEARNDENLIIAQLHQTFLRFHNAAFDRTDDSLASEERFAIAKRFTTETYHRLLLNEYLPAIVGENVVEETLLRGSDEAKAWVSGPDGELSLPVEFAVAAFRFGHSQIRDSYDWNKNNPEASLEQLFSATHLSGRMKDNIPAEQVADWRRFTTPDADHFARPIDAALSLGLNALPGQGGRDEMMQQLLASLARRNLRRGFQMNLPTGQAVASAMGIEPMSAEDLRRNFEDVFDATATSKSLLENTPLWFYILKEAEVLAEEQEKSGETAQGTLGPVGARIVAQTLIGLLEAAPERSENGLTERSVSAPAIECFSDFFRFAGVWHDAGE